MWRNFHFVPTTHLLGAISKGRIRKNSSIRKFLDDALGSAKGNEIQDQTFKWLEKTKCSRALTLAVSYVVAQFEHKKPKKTEDPLPITPNFLGAMETHHARFHVAGREKNAAASSEKTTRRNRTNHSRANKN
jgi:hypothetical protein